MKNISILITFLLFFSTLNAKISVKQKVSIELKWKHSFQFAGYYAAIYKGFYEEEGLEVTLKEIDFQKSPIQKVLDGESQYGVSDSTLAIHRLKGENVVLISQIFQQSPLVLISLYESQITTPYEMIGKKISYAFDGYGGTPINAMFLNAIGSLQNIDIVPFSSYEDLINKKVDAISAYTTSQPFYLAKKGVKVNIIDPKSYGIDFYGDNFFTSQKELSTHPKRVAKMKKATLKGWEYALENQDEIIDIILKTYAPKADKELLKLEAKSTYQMIMPNFKKLGNINRYKYQNVAQTYYKLGLVKNPKIDNDFFYKENFKNISKQISLSQAEKRWLEKNPTIFFAGNPNWLPFEAFNKNGEYIGIVAEYLKELEKKIGIKIKPKITSSWQETLDLSQKHQLDIISGEIDDMILKQNYKPITPYSTIPIVIIMREDNSFIDDLKDIKDKKIAIVNDYGYTHKLIENYKDIPFIQVKNPKDALSGLVYEKYDAILLSMPAASYLIKAQGFNTLKIVGKTSIQMKSTLFIHEDKPFLRSLIEKSMSEIKNNENLNRWQKIEFVTNVDYTILYQLFGVFLLILIAIIVWNYKLASEIKKRKKLNIALKESETQIRTLIDNILLYVVVTTIEGKILLANPKTIKDYNLSSEDIENYNILEFYVDTNERIEVIETLKKDGVVKEKIIKLKNYNGDIDNIMISILPIMYDGQDALLTIGVDLTQRMKMEKELSKAKKQAELANLSKSEFLANMSHEIRTPMNSVIGFSNLLEKLITDPIQKDYLSSIKRGGSALLDIINDILDLSKIEAGKLEIILESVNIKQLVLEMESIFSIKLMQKNLNFEVAIDDSIPKYLLLDSARIRQILFNIIGNAIKFTDSGVIKLSVKKIFDDEKKSKIDLALIVEDTGIGIDAKNLKSIFNSFEQQKGQNQKYGGTGLGLTICKKLLNFMNGDIEVQSKLKEGSKFTVYLKDISVSLIENEKKQPQFIAESIEFNSATILVVDDIKDNRKLIKSALKNYGLKIYEAQNGKDALEKLKSIKVDLICMDIKMPIMDGYEAISIIKKNSLLKDIPVVAITASVMGKDMQKIKEYKFDGYLRKPVSYDELILELTKFLTYNTYELKQKKDASIEENTYVDLPKTVKILQEVYIKKWTKIKDMGDFSLILEFATNLIDLANLHPNNLLLTYAKELKLNCESFDIERIDFMMNSFPNLIAKLENILQKDKA